MRKLCWTDVDRSSPQGYGIFRWSAGRRDGWPGGNEGEGGVWAGLWRGTGRQYEVGQGRECGSESLRVKLAQREAVACGSRAVDGYGSGVGGGSRPHRVSRREPANEEKVADMAMRADGRFCGSGVGGVVIG